MAMKKPIDGFTYRPGSATLKTYQYKKLIPCKFCGKRFRVIHNLQKVCPECRMKTDKDYKAKYRRLKRAFDKKANGDA